MAKAGIWRVRPAGARDAGRAVNFERLRDAIDEEEIGDLDEVQGPGEARWTTVAEHPVTGPLVPRQRRVVVREEEQAESDLTPMIDVTFQLLIFFMIAATYTIQKTLDLPSAQPAEEAAGAVTMQELERNNIIVAIAADGTVRVNDQMVPHDQLVDRLQEASRQAQHSELVLDVHGQAVHDVVVQVLDAAGAARFEKVLFVSRVKPGRPADGAAPSADASSGT
ncbi:MAG: biopolymer transporter ExbD [Candidatus Anammoximicrobium sp.]|nr:biopolymer transporter ExbD [Candidatus Anammoximicrobium sp.]